MNYFAFTGLLNGLTSLSLGVYSLARGYRSQLNRSYSLFAFSVFWWSCGYFFWQLSATSEGALFWSRFFMSGAIFIPATYFNFSLRLTNKYHEKRWQSLLSYLICFVFLVLNFTPLIVAGVSKKLFFDFWPLPGLFYMPFLAMFFYYVIYSLFIMYSVFNQASGHLKTQIMYVFLGTMIGFVGGSTNYLLWYDIPIPPIANILVVAYPLFLAYAITKHEFMDIRVEISRSAAYGFVGLLIIASFIVLSLVPLPAALVVFANALLALIWAFAAHRLRDIIQTPLEEKWITGWYNSDRLINQIATKLIPVIEKKDVYRIVADELKSAIKIKNIEVITGRPQVDYHGLTQTKNGLVMPFSSSDGVEGALILGQKTSEDPYTERDMTIFKTIMIQCMAILDRIRPYEQIKKELDRSQRLASLGTITAGVAHEIRNPLGIIHSKTQRLLDKPRDLEYLRQFQNDVLENSRRITKIIRGMQSLSKVKEKKEVKVNLNDLIEATLALIPISRISLKKGLAPVSDIMADPDELKQVFINLISNAIEAMPESGELTISTSQEGTNVTVQFSDTGHGIAPENIHRIFDPFFSTHHEGAGLGLSIAHRIVVENNGSIDVKSKVGEGTTFILKFPAL